jgi:hypothetical protein
MKLDSPHPTKIEPGSFDSRHRHHEKGELQLPMQTQAQAMG